MSETGDTEARVTPAGIIVSRGRLAAIAIMAALAVVVGLGGGFLLRGWIGDPAAVAGGELDPGNVSQRAEDWVGGVAQESATDGQAGTEAESGSGADPAPSTVPGKDPMAAWLAEEAARIAERARLASDSPLARPVTEAAELVELWRPDALAPTPVADLAAAASPQAGVAAAAPPLPATLASAAANDETHVLVRGSVIPAVLESSIDSDLPGLVRAKVAENVYDTVTGSHLLVPKGSWLVGTYGSGAPTGQRRLFVSWTDLHLPDGTPVPLGGMASLGADGASGVRGRRSTGIWSALGAAVLFDLAGNASQILIATETGQAPARRDGLAEILGEAVGNSTSQVGQEHLRELLDRGARFRVSAGARMNVVVEESMHLAAQPARGAW